MHRCGPAGTSACRRSRRPPDIQSTGETPALTRRQIGNHTFRATGITEYLRNGGKLEIAQRMANHESARTTGLKTYATIRCRWMRWSGY